MRAVSTWSLHRTLGRFVAPDSATFGGAFLAGPPMPSGLSLLALPAALRARGYETLQICHFHLPRRDPAYLAELRAACAAAEVAIDTLLIDDGDLLAGDDPAHVEAWVGDWLAVAAALGAARARVIAGRDGPPPDRVRAGTNRLRRLASAYPEVRLVVENWTGLLADAAAIEALLDETGGAVGLLLDLGNWRGPAKYDQLARIAPVAETCHAKCHFTGAEPDAADFQRSLRILRDSGYTGPLALIYDGPDDDEWGMLEVESALVRAVFGDRAAAPPSG